MTTSPGGQNRIPLQRLQLEFPRSLAVYDSYEEAQKAVDHLSDESFPVENVMIVGTDLKQVERVTGRLTLSKVLAGGALSGMWMGLLIGLLLSIFVPEGSPATLLSAVLAGAFFFLVWAGMGYALTRGRRDFTSVSQVVATRYEVLVEHRAYGQARDLLVGMAGVSAGLHRAAADPSTSPQRESRPNPYEGLYGQKADPADVDAAAGPASTGAHAAPRPSEQNRPNPYEGLYGQRLEPGDEPPRPDDEQAPPNPRG